MSLISEKTTHYPYAQTNIQLFNQLRDEGYATNDLVCVYKAYELARCLLTGLYFACGKSSLAHVVGTASILGRLNLPIEVVAAGLLHNIYRDGDFGYGSKNRMSATKRDQVRCVVGDTVEEYIPKYLATRWNLKSLLTIQDCLDNHEIIMRHVILMKLANELEHHLDLDILYFPDAQKRCQRINNIGPVMVDIAKNLGYLTLGEELIIAFERVALAEIPMELCGPKELKRVFVSAPQSYRKRLLLPFRQKLDHEGHRWRRRLGKILRPMAIDQRRAKKDPSLTRI